MRKMFSILFLLSAFISSCGPVTPILPTPALAPSYTPHPTLVPTSTPTKIPDTACEADSENNPIQTEDKNEPIIIDASDINARSIQFDHSGKRLALANSDGIRIYDAATGEWLCTLSSSNDDKIIMTSFSPDNIHLASIDYEGSVKIWNLINKTIQFTLNPKTEKAVWVPTATSIYYSGDGTRIAASLATALGSLHSEPNFVKVWNSSDGSLVLDQKIWANGIGISSDGKRLGVGGDAGFIIYDIDSGEIVLEQTIRQPATQIIFSKDGNIIFTKSWATSGITEWDADTGEPIFTYTDCNRYCIVEGPMDDYRRFSISDDGYLIANSRFDRIYLWQRNSMLSFFDVINLDEPDRRVLDLYLSPSGETIAALVSYEIDSKRMMRVYIWKTGYTQEQ